MATPSGFLASTGVGRADPRRRHRLPVPPLRPDRRQPALRRRGARRRHVRHRQRELAPRPVLGAARRRRQLRRRHLVHVPLPRHRRARHDHRRPGALRLRRHRRGDALVPRAAARRCPRSSAAGSRCSPSRRRRRSPRSCGDARPAASSGATPGRTTGPTRCSSRSGRSARRCWSGCSRCRSPRCRARSTRSTRPGCSGTGGRTSSTRSPTRRSTCTSSTARSCRPVTPPCTCTRSTAPPAGCPTDATAFAYRDGGWAGVIVGRRPRPGQRRPPSRQWARDYWEELHPTSAGGAYVNFMMNEGQDRVEASYRGNYDRLAQVKQPLRPGQHVPHQPEHPARQRVQPVGP